MNSLSTSFKPNYGEKDEMKAERKKGTHLDG
jgi:hypothetical protein